MSRATDRPMTDKYKALVRDIESTVTKMVMAGEGERHVIWDAIDEILQSAGVTIGGVDRNAVLDEAVAMVTVSGYTETVRAIRALKSAPSAAMVDDAESVPAKTFSLALDVIQELLKAGWTPPQQTDEVAK